MGRIAVGGMGMWRNRAGVGYSAADKRCPALHICFSEAVSATIVSRSEDRSVGGTVDRVYAMIGNRLPEVWEGRRGDPELRR